MKIYDAFINAGFAKEANQLSETVKTEKGRRIKPSLGHYIAVLDNYKEYGFYFQQKLKDLVMVSGIQIKEFVNLKLKSENHDEAQRAKNLRSILEGRLD